jgi:hypothetical protein
MINKEDNNKSKETFPDLYISQTTAQNVEPEPRFHGNKTKQTGNRYETKGYLISYAFLQSKAGH